MADCALGVHGARRYRLPVAARFRNGCGLVVSMSGLIAASELKKRGENRLERRRLTGPRFGRVILEGSPDAGRARPADRVVAPPTGQYLDLFLTGHREK